LHAFSALQKGGNPALINEDHGAPPRSRGTIALLEENCTVCMLCVRECPDWCIEIEGHTEQAPPAREGGRPRTRHVLDRFAIDFSLCMYCGICVEVCPFDALFWAPELVPPEQARAGLVEESDALQGWIGAVPAPPPLDPAAEPAPEMTAAERLDAVAAARGQLPPPSSAP
jgi:NADH-quinone oxidoreductase subunit I